MTTSLCTNQNTSSEYIFNMYYNITGLLLCRTHHLNIYNNITDLPLYRIYDLNIYYNITGLLLYRTHHLNIYYNIIFSSLYFPFVVLQYPTLFSFVHFSYPLHFRKYSIQAISLFISMIVAPLTLSLGTPCISKTTCDAAIFTQA